MQLCWTWSSSQFGSESDWISNNMCLLKIIKRKSIRGMNVVFSTVTFYCRVDVIVSFGTIATPWCYCILLIPFFFFFIFLQSSNTSPREKRVITTTIPAAYQLISDRNLILIFFFAMDLFRRLSFFWAFCTQNKVTKKKKTRLGLHSDNHLKG